MLEHQARTTTPPSRCAGHGTPLRLVPRRKPPCPAAGKCCRTASTVRRCLRQRRRFVVRPVPDPCSDAPLPLRGHRRSLIPEGEERPALRSSVFCAPCAALVRLGKRSPPVAQRDPSRRLAPRCRRGRRHPRRPEPRRPSRHPPEHHRYPEGMNHSRHGHEHPQTRTAKPRTFRRQSGGKRPTGRGLWRGSACPVGRGRHAGRLPPDGVPRPNGLCPTLR